MLVFCGDHRIMKKQPKTVTVTCITCPICKETIYSRARHDFRHCKCGDTFIDGGFDYARYGSEGVPILSNKDVNATKRELYDDWNTGTDKFGKIE